MKAVKTGRVYDLQQPDFNASANMMFSQALNKLSNCCTLESDQNEEKVIWINLILAVLLISTIFFALTHGASNFSMQKMTNSQLNILFNIRVPRIISALVAGASLSVSGAFFQATCAIRLQNLELWGSLVQPVYVNC